MKVRTGYLFILAALLSGTANLPAQVDKKVDIHGFGAWAYGRTDGNKYIGGTNNGSYNQSWFALNVASTPYPNLTVNAQTFWVQDGDKEEVELDFAFAEWQVSDLFKFRVGRVKHPFGIYTEIFDVGTLRPFFKLPQGIYGNAGFISESYQGLGITGSYYSSREWGITYDIYGGGIGIESENPFESLGNGEDDGSIEEGGEEEETSPLRDMIGGRVTVTIPIHGLNFGFSGYAGDEEEADHRHKVYGFHAEYLSGAWTLRSEYANLDEGHEHRADAFYLEGAYNLNEHWQVAVRYDWFDAELDPENVNVSAAPSLLEHEDFALGLSYWFNTNFVLKLSYHIVSGNHFALPEDVADAVATGDLNTTTRGILAGGQFSF